MMLMQGLGSLGSGLGQGLAAMGQQMERQREERKRESDEFKALQALAKAAYGMEPDQTTAMGLPDLRGLVRGKELERIEAERKQRGEYNALQMEQLRESLAQQRNRAAVQQGNARALPEILKRSQGQQAPAPMRDPGMAFQQRPMDLRGLAGIAQAEGYQMESPADLQALGEVVLPKDRPVLPPNFVPKSAKIGGIEYGAPEEPEKEEFITDPRTGANFLRLGRTILNSDRKQPGAELPNDSSLYGEDEVAFEKYVQALPSQDMREQAVEFRTKLMNSRKKGKFDFNTYLLMKMEDPKAAMEYMQGFTKPAAPKPAAPAAGADEVFDFDIKTRGIKLVK